MRTVEIDRPGALEQTHIEFGCQGRPRLLSKSLDSHIPTERHRQCRLGIDRTVAGGDQRQGTTIAGVAQCSGRAPTGCTGTHDHDRLTGLRGQHAGA